MIELIKSLRIVPVVAISDASKAADLASALVAGGLPIAEITLRTPASLEALQVIKIYLLVLGRCVRVKI